LKKSLADVIFELGEYYAFIISAFLYNDIHRLPTEEDIKSCDKQERNLQRAIVACRDLLDLTAHEPGIKGPFPGDFYNEMIISTQNLLDRLCNLKSAVVCMPIEVRRQTTHPSVYLYRRDMVSKQNHQVSTVGSMVLISFPHGRLRRCYSIFIP
jgi:hypothetical protein